MKKIFILIFLTALLSGCNITTEKSPLDWEKLACEKFDANETSLTLKGPKHTFVITSKKQAGFNIKQIANYESTDASQNNGKYQTIINENDRIISISDKINAGSRLYSINLLIQSNNDLFDVFTIKNSPFNKEDESYFVNSFKKFSYQDLEKTLQKNCMRK